MFGGCGCVKRALKLGVKAVSFREMTKSGTAELELVRLLPRTQVRQNHFSQTQSPGRDMQSPRLTKVNPDYNAPALGGPGEQAGACEVKYNCWPSGISQEPQAVQSKATVGWK